MLSVWEREIVRRNGCERCCVSRELRVRSGPLDCVDPTAHNLPPQFNPRPLDGKIGRTREARQSAWRRSNGPQLITTIYSCPSDGRIERTREVRQSPARQRSDIPLMTCLILYTGFITKICCMSLKIVPNL